MLLRFVTSVQGKEYIYLEVGSLEMKGQDFVNVHQAVVFPRCCTVTLAADVRRIPDLYPRFRMITKHCGSFCAFSDQLDKPSCHFCCLARGFWQHGSLRSQRFAVDFYLCAQNVFIMSLPLAFQITLLHV